MYKEVHHYKKKSHTQMPIHTLLFVHKEQLTTCLITLICCERELWKDKYVFKAARYICLGKLFEEMISKFKTLLFHNKTYREWSHQSFQWKIKTKHFQDIYNANKVHFCYYTSNGSFKWSQWYIKYLQQLSFITWRIKTLWFSCWK